jgi:hypothetical protein
MIANSEVDVLIMGAKLIVVLGNFILSEIAVLEHFLLKFLCNCCASALHNINIIYGKKTSYSIDNYLDDLRYNKEEKLGRYH